MKLVHFMHQLLAWFVCGGGKIWWVVSGIFQRGQQGLLVVVVDDVCGVAVQSKNEGLNCGLWTFVVDKWHAS